MEIIVLLLIVSLIVSYGVGVFLWPRGAKKDTASPPVGVPKAKTKARSGTEIAPLIDQLPQGVVAFVKDGDTFEAVIDGMRTAIRLDSIDCPEGDQPWGVKAKFGLVKLIGGKTVRLEIHGLDDYGRTLATLYVQNEESTDWMNVNERMVMLGHAWVLGKYYDHLPTDRQSALQGLERWARSKSVGLWRDPNPIPPWKWRKTGRDGAGTSA